MVVAELQGFENLAGSRRAGSGAAAELAIDAELYMADRLERSQRGLSRKVNPRFLQGMLQHPFE